MFALLSKLEKKGTNRTDLARDFRADLPGDFKQRMACIYLTRRTMTRGPALNRCSDRWGDGCVFHGVGRGIQR